VIEVEVHQQLHAFLREQHQSQWPHHLTMARLVARALRIGRSALIQTSTHHHYSLSYLLPVLLWSGPVLLVVPEAAQQRLLLAEVPQLQQWLQTAKSILRGERWPDPSFNGVLLTTPEVWLRDRLNQTHAFPAGIPVILDKTDDLEFWVREAVTAHIQTADWNDLRLTFPRWADSIRDTQAQFTHTTFQHPPNPYGCHLCDADEIGILQQLFEMLSIHACPQQDQAFGFTWPPTWQNFWQTIHQPHCIIWSVVSRHSGQFSVCAAPADVSQALATVWDQQPVILIGNTLDLEPDASIYRQRIGIGDLTCVKFLPDRHSKALQLYLPDHLPLPNNPQFHATLTRELEGLILAGTPTGITVLIVGDTPLKTQVGTFLAAEFGSRVQVERTNLDENGILVTGWTFWQQQQQHLPVPQVLGIATLPIPSLEDPLVAGRVDYYKQHHQDWFRLYLLPTALGELQRTISPLREQQGLVAIFDGRMIHRSYGKQILDALSPVARMNYLERDRSLRSSPNLYVLE
jgi:ATP-dependent DNA helicase DinG